MVVVPFPQEYPRMKSLVPALVVLMALVLPGVLYAEEEVKMEVATDPVCIIKTSMGDITLELFAAEAPKTVQNFLDLAEGKREFTDVQTGEKVKRPFYDGLAFHRVIKDFMIQGGCPKGDGTGGPGYQFEDEINAKSLGLDDLKVMQPEGRVHPWLMVRSQDDFNRNIMAPLFGKLGITSQEQLTARQDDVKKQLDALTLKGCYENMGYKYIDGASSHAPKRGVIAMANAGPNTNGSQFFITIDDCTRKLTKDYNLFGYVVEGIEAAQATQVGDVMESVVVEERPRG